MVKRSSRDRRAPAACAPSPGTSSRRPGRPLAGGNDVGRDGLIAVARQVYSETEPARVTRQMIAERAGVDPNLIRYYFGTMNQLMAEVVLHTLHQARGQVAADGDEDPQARLDARIERIFRLFSDQPNHHKMVVSSLYDAEETAAHGNWVRFLADSLRELEAIIEQGVEQGRMEGVDPRFLHLTIIAASEFWASNEPVIELICGAGTSASTLRPMYLAFLQSFVRRALGAADGEQGRPGRGATGHRSD